MIRNFNSKTIFDDIAESKVDVIHRKLLKFMLGVSKFCPNLAHTAKLGKPICPLKDVD